MKKTMYSVLLVLFLATTSHAQQMPVFEETLGKIIDAQSRRAAIQEMMDADQAIDPDVLTAWNGVSLQTGSLLSSAMAWMYLASNLMPANPLHILFVGYADALAEQAKLLLDDWM